MRLRVKALFVILPALVLSGCSASKRQIETLRRAEDAGQRAAAAEALGQAALKPERRAEVVEALREASVDPSPEVRAKAIEALGKLGGPEATAALADALTGHNYTAAALGSFGNANSLAPDSPEVMLGLARSQTELGGPDHLKAAEESLDDLGKLLEQIDPQQAQQHIYALKFAYDNLKLKFQAAGNAAKVKALETKIAAIDAKISTLDTSGGMGGFPMGGGMPMGGMPMGGGGLPIQLP